MTSSQNFALEVDQEASDYFLPFRLNPFPQMMFALKNLQPFLFDDFHLAFRRQTVR